MQGKNRNNNIKQKSTILPYAALLLANEIAGDLKE
jgi:hypothetical protein